VSAHSLRVASATPRIFLISAPHTYLPSIKC
jgi:hypothetical protein